tara:strand:- start:46 stop:630 length:585 start_codon:yes stop_codon:yes gene_type:complete
MIKSIQNAKKRILKPHFIILIIGLIIFWSYSTERYYKKYPGIPIHPKNQEEVKIVEEYINTRDKEMYEFLKITDKSITSVFKPHVKETSQEMNKLIYKNLSIIMFIKNIFNRARPYQVNKDLKYYKTPSSSSPSFPSGHSLQAHYLARQLSKKYPEKRELFYELAEKIGLGRIYAGVHYPSDHKFAKILAEILP